MITRALLPLLLLIACKPEDRDPKGTGDDSPADTGDEEDDTAFVPTYEAWMGDLPTDFLGLANVDDDDEDGVVDFLDDAALSDDDEVLQIALPAGAFTGDDGVLSLAITGDVSLVRATWQGQVVLGEELTQNTITGTEDGDLLIDLGGFNLTAELTLSRGGESGEESVTIPLSSAPLLLNHHLQLTEHATAVAISGMGGNEDMLADFEATLGDAFDAPSATPYEWDLWVQDEIEFGTSSLPDGAQMIVVLDSIRSRNDQNLDRFAEDNYLAPGVGVATRGQGMPTSQDSFGNLEVSPPVTVDGIEYPFGRIYWGIWNGGGLTDQLAETLNNQKLQAPFQLDVSFVCVGHVDEFSSFIPDPSAPKGFRLYLANTDMGREFLEAQDPAYAIPKYTRAHGFDTAGGILEDTDLLEYNAEIQTDYLDPAREIFKAELGLDEDDIVDMPALFEKVAGCRGAGVSLIPGTINLAVEQVGADGEVHLFMPDPFFRDTTTEQSDDPFIAAIEEILPADATYHWVDDWSSYHIYMGEVHCGTNTRRAQSGAWWEDAEHLMGGE